MIPNRLPKPLRPSLLTHQSQAGFFLHERAEDQPQLPVARFTRAADGKRIYAFACNFPAKGDRAQLLYSDDEGDSWQSLGPLCADTPIMPSDSGAFMCTRSGTLIAAFGNMAERANWNWDPELKDSPGATCPTYVTRSLDGGRTWQDTQRLHREWTGANRDIIETRDGRIVFTSMKLLHQPGRHTVLTYASDDDGRSWTASNLLDFGGNGHHDGVTEATLIELRDGRLLKYMRTNWGQFWRALSTDAGSHWHVYGPTGIDASSAPGALMRLASGRVALAWNRWLPESGDAVPLQGGDGNWSATPASNFREELALSFSADECETWSPPVVIARNPDSETSYPYIFEPRPGLLWITAHRWGLRLQLREDDFASG